MKKLIFILLLLVLLVVGTVFALNQKSESDTAPLELNEEVKKEREEQAKQNKLEEERVKNLINEEKLIKVTDNSIDVYYKVDESKFIGYEILHSSERLDTSVNSSNYDVWHINNANLFSFENGKFSKEKDFVTYGEWDLTLKETGANDYSGGKAHGDEITNEFRVTVDGNEPENDKLIAFENVKVSTNSTIYRDSTIEEGIEIASKNRTILFDENQLVYRNLTINLEKNAVRVGQETLPILGKELNLLIYLIQNKGIILTKEQIFDRIWGFNSETAITVVEVCMSNLRKHLKAHQLDKSITTIRNVGYMLTETEEE